MSAHAQHSARHSARHPCSALRSGPMISVAHMSAKSSSNNSHNPSEVICNPMTTFENPPFVVVWWKWRRWNLSIGSFYNECSIYPLSPYPQFMFTVHCRMFSYENPYLEKYEIGTFIHKMPSLFLPFFTPNFYQ